MPEISVVLPVYNGAENIGKSIESILEQTYSDFELIVVNDCSTDNTLEVVSKYAEKDKRIHVFSNETNLKLPASLNVGFQKAMGKFLTWTSDDNFYESNAFEVMIKCLLEHEQTDMVFCGMNIIDQDGHLLEEIRPEKLENIIKHNIIGACFLYTREIAEKIGKYDETLFLAEDYDYWLRIYEQGQIANVEKVLYNYRAHEKSLTATRGLEIKNVTMDVIIKHLRHHQYV